MKNSFPRAGLGKGFRNLVMTGVVLLSGNSLGYGQALDEQGVGPFRTQTIQLEAGWNAVYLEVEPLKGEPSALFEGTPIEIAAAFFRPVTAMEFIDSPNEILPDRKGWSVWYAPARDDALLSNLYAIQAHRAYLLYTKQRYAWNLRGVPLHGGTRWHPNAYSMVGFPIATDAQTTMANFFAGAASHSPLKIYRLTAGRWALVTNPEQVLMQPGAAYWVYSTGASEFRGPLTVELAGSAAGGLIFTEDAETLQLEIRNVSIFPQELTLTLRAGTTGLPPVAYVVRVLNGPDQPIEPVSVPFPETLALGTLEAGQAFTLDLEVVQEAVTVPVMSATLSISTDAGLHLEVPLVSIRRDLLIP